MKDKIAKFYDEHDELVSWICATTGAAVVLGAFAYMARSLEVTGAHEFTTDSGREGLIIEQRNGKITRLGKNKPELEV